MARKKKITKTVDKRDVGTTETRRRVTPIPFYLPTSILIVCKPRWPSVPHSRMASVRRHWIWFVSAAVNYWDDNVRTPITKTLHDMIIAEIGTRAAENWEDDCVADDEDDHEE